MKRKKTVMDEKIGAAQVERGVLLIQYRHRQRQVEFRLRHGCPGIGHGMKIGVCNSSRADPIQAKPLSSPFFRMKSAFILWAKGLLGKRRIALAMLPPLRRLGSGMPFCVIRRSALSCWMNWPVALKHRYLDLAVVLADLKARPSQQHVVVTGRGAPEELIEMADTVTEMALVKHAFAAGVKAQKGIEW